MSVFLKSIYRALAGDYRCSKCDSGLVPWRSGDWVCPVHDLTPPITQNSFLGRYVSDRGQEMIERGLIK